MTVALACRGVGVAETGTNAVDDGSVMSSTATSTARGDLGAAGAFTSVLNAAVGSAAAALEQKVSRLTDKLDDVAAGNGLSKSLKAVADQGLDDVAQGGGAKQAAGAEAVKAGLHGKNPAWAAVKGAWHAGTPVVRAAVIAGAASAVLLLLLSPVPLLVFLLSLLVLAAIQRARAGKEERQAQLD
jgi:hypothetical protein